MNLRVATAGVATVAATALYLRNSGMQDRGMQNPASGVMPSAGLEAPTTGPDGDQLLRSGPDSEDADAADRIQFWLQQEGAHSSVPKETGTVKDGDLVALETRRGKLLRVQTHLDPKKPPQLYSEAIGGAQDQPGRVPVMPHIPAEGLFMVAAKEGTYTLIPISAPGYALTASSRRAVQPVCLSRAAPSATEQQWTEGHGTLANTKHKDMVLSMQMVGTHTSLRDQVEQFQAQSQGAAAQAVSKAQELAAQADSLRHTLALRDQQLAAAQAQLQQLQQAPAAAAAATHALSGSGDTGSWLHSRRQVQVHQPQVDVEQLQAELLELRQQLQVAQGQEAAAQSELGVVRGQLVVARGLGEAAQGEVAMLRSTLQEAQGREAGLREEMGLLRERWSVAEGREDTWRQEADQLRAVAREAQQQEEELRAEVEQLRAEVEQLREQLEAQLDMQDELEQLREQLAGQLDLQEEVEELREQLAGQSDLQDELEQLREQLAAQPDLQEEADQLRDEALQLRQQLQDAQSEAASTWQQLLLGQRQQQSDVQQTLELQRALTQQQRACKETEQRCDILTAEADQLQVALNRAREEDRALTVQAQGLQQQQRLTAAALDGKERQLQASRAELARVQEALALTRDMSAAHLGTINAGLQREVSLQDELQSAHAQLAVRDQQIEVLLGKCTKLGVAMQGIDLHLGTLNDTSFSRAARKSIQATKYDQLVRKFAQLHPGGPVAATATSQPPPSPPLPPNDVPGRGPVSGVGPVRGEHGGLCVPRSGSSSCLSSSPPSPVRVQGEGCATLDLQASGGLGLGRAGSWSSSAPRTPQDLSSAGAGGDGGGGDLPALQAVGGAGGSGSGNGAANGREDYPSGGDGRVLAAASAMASIAAASTSSAAAAPGVDDQPVEQEQDGQVGSLEHLMLSTSLDLRSSIGMHLPPSSWRGARSIRTGGGGAGQGPPGARVSSSAPGSPGWMGYLMGAGAWPPGEASGGAGGGAAGGAAEVGTGGVLRASLGHLTGAGVSGHGHDARSQAGADQAGAFADVQGAVTAAADSSPLSIGSRVGLSQAEADLFAHGVLAGARAAAGQAAQQASPARLPMATEAAGSSGATSVAAASPASGSAGGNTGSGGGVLPVTVGSPGVREGAQGAGPDPVPHAPVASVALHEPVATGGLAAQAIPGGSEAAVAAAAQPAPGSPAAEAAAAAQPTPAGISEATAAKAAAGLDGSGTAALPDTQVQVAAAADLAVTLQSPGQVATAVESDSARTPAQAASKTVLQNRGYAQLRVLANQKMQSPGTEDDGEDEFDGGLTSPGASVPPAAMLLTPLHELFLRSSSKSVRHSKSSDDSGDDEREVAVRPRRLSVGGYGGAGAGRLASAHTVTSFHASGRLSTIFQDVPAAQELVEGQPPVAAADLQLPASPPAAERAECAVGHVAPVVSPPVADALEPTSVQSASQRPAPGLLPWQGSGLPKQALASHALHLAPEPGED